MRPCHRAESSPDQPINEYHDRPSSSKVQAIRNNRAVGSTLLTSLQPVVWPLGCLNAVLGGFEGAAGISGSRPLGELMATSRDPCSCVHGGLRWVIMEELEHREAPRQPPWKYGAGSFIRTPFAEAAMSPAPFLGLAHTETYKLYHHRARHKPPYLARCAGCWSLRFVIA